MKASYRVEVKRSAQKELRTVPKSELVRLLGRLRGLKTDPRPAGCKKMADTDHFRIRQGDWRVVYEIDSEARCVTVIKVGHRKEVYR